MKFRSLSNQVLKHVLIVYFSVTIVITIIHFGVEFFYQKELLMDELHLVEKTFKPSLGNSLWDMNTNQLSKDAEGILSLSFIKAIRIEDKNENEIYREKSSCIECQNSNYKHSFKIYREIFGKSIPLGEVTLYSDSSSVIQKLKVNFAIIFLNALIESITLILLFIVVFRKTLNAPLESITKQIASLDLNNIKNAKVVYESHHNNELMILKDSVNQMLAKLNEEIEKGSSKDSLLYQQNKMASMGEMIGNISHQWKQPLNAISINLFMLKEEIDSADSKLYNSLTKRFGDMELQINHMSNTIDDFRRFLKPDVEKKEFDMNSTIHKALAILQTNIKRSNTTIQVNIPPESFIYGFENQLLHVIINLIKNSIDALKEIDTPRVIKIDGEATRSGFVLTLKDSGGGIREDLVARVFDKYFTTKTESNGTGLGLHMSKEIIEKNFNAKIDVHNEEFTQDGKTYKGACFTIEFFMSTI